MEKRVTSLIGPGGTDDRVDIKYRKSGSAHVIVELKRAKRRVTTLELLQQIDRYRIPIRRFLKSSIGEDVEVQVVCVVGVDPADWGYEGGREVSRKQLEAANAKIVTYNELITNARESYAEFLDANNGIGKVREVITRIEEDLSPRPQ